jgi:hypothetical protein
VLYIHGLNPHGFSWWRRTTHENVDLNRNFRDFAPTRRPTTATTRSRRARSRDLAGRRADDRRARRFVAAHGERALQQAISGGQYRHPDGLFYGGSGRPGATRRCARCCASTAARCARLAGSIFTPASARAATANASSPVATTPTHTRAPRRGGAT